MVRYSFSQGRLFHVSISFLDNFSIIKRISKHTIQCTPSFWSTGSSFWERDVVFLAFCMPLSKLLSLDLFYFFFIPVVVSRIWQLGAFLLDLRQLHPIINYGVKMIGWFLCICTATGVCYYQPNTFILNTRPVLLKYKAPSWKAIAVVILPSESPRGCFLISQASPEHHRTHSAPWLPQP